MSGAGGPVQTSPRAYRVCPWGLLAHRKQTHSSLGEACHGLERWFLTTPSLSAITPRGGGAFFSPTRREGIVAVTLRRPATAAPRTAVPDPRSSLSHKCHHHLGTPHRGVMVDPPRSSLQRRPEGLRTKILRSRAASADDGPYFATSQLMDI